LILDSGGLLDYDMAWNLRAAALGQGPAPLGARAIAAFGGNLYVLDTSAGQLWRYRPLAEGYGNPQEPYFEKPVTELNTVVDMAIDGNVYLLQADGRIRKFFGGSEKPFNVGGLTEALKKPVAISVDAEARRGAVYIADGGAARIVHLNTDGALVRQIRASNDAFNALQELFVDERAGRLYVISGGKLYTARVPAAP
jgi:outer membrane protein assembly factor BamB